MPPWVHPSMKKYTFSYAMIYVKSILLMKNLDIEILAPPPGRFCPLPMENFLAAPLSLQHNSTLVDNTTN